MNPRILVVDDELQLRRIVGRSLRGHGYDTREAATGSEALATCAAFKPDVVVLDLMLPDMTGTEVCRVLRQTYETPIVVLSVVGDERAKVEALDAGADDYVTKPFGMDELLARISPTADYAALKDCDLVIEAVYEDRKVKYDVVAKIQAVIGDKAILGSNTSTLPITTLASEFKDPARFIGIHFFSPVDRMMLVEIILGKQTGDKALAVALDYVRAIRKTPIVVNDSRGFYTSRVVGTYIREGHLMLTEGVPPAMIENVGRMAGMPVGPLALNDEVAVDLAWKILKATEADLGAKAIDPRQKKLLQEMVEKRGRFGRKNGKGFYDYPANGPKKLWPDLTDLQPKQLDPDKIDIDELKLRLLGIQALETARCFEEKVLTDVREADVGSILGFGFAPFSGGTLSWIDNAAEPVHSEFRDDRFSAAFERSSRDKPVFTVAYVVRAVSPGRYVLPQAYVEDMYRPDRFGRTATGNIEVTTAK